MQARQHAAIKVRRLEGAQVQSMKERQHKGTPAKKKNARMQVRKHKGRKHIGELAQ
jgi:hypothetical protein